MKKFAVNFLVTLALLSASLYPGKLAVLPEINNPSMIDVCGSELFILDGEQVVVYSLKNYRLLNRFGKKGEGPGELITSIDMPLTMKVKGKQVLLNSATKMIVFSKSGKMLREIKTSFPLIEAQPIGKNYAVTIFKRDKKSSGMASTWIYNQNFKEIKKIYETNVPNDYKKKRIAVPMISTFLRCCNNKIFVFDQQKGFRIKIFNQAGKSLPGIKIPYSKIKTSDAFKKKMMAVLSTYPAYKQASTEWRGMVYIPEYLPVIRNCLIDGKKLYVQTYRMKGELSEFYILDFSGKVLKKVFLPGADGEQVRVNPACTYAIQGNRYYYLLEDIEEEQWELFVKKI